MKILIHEAISGAHSYLNLALAKAFLALGHECRVWFSNKKPAADVFDEYSPDYFLTQSYVLTDHICELIHERPWLRICCRVPDWSTMADGVAQKFPILTATEEEVNRLVSLRDEIGEPTLIHCHYPQKYLNKTHENWIKKGFNITSLLNFADPWSYSHGVFREEFASDLAFIGYRHPYKAKVLDPWLAPFVNPDGKYTTKIAGNGWSGSHAVGYLAEELCRDFLRSATVCPNLHEPHSHYGGYDIIQRPMNLLLNKCFIVSDRVEGLVEIIPDGIVYAASPNEFKEKIDYFLENPNERSQFIERGYKIVRDSHTSLDRAKFLLDQIGVHTPQQIIDEIKMRLEL